MGIKRDGIDRPSSFVLLKGSLVIIVVLWLSILIMAGYMVYSMNKLENDFHETTQGIIMDMKQFNNQFHK